MSEPDGLKELRLEKESLLTELENARGACQRVEVEALEMAMSALDDLIELCLGSHTARI